MFSTPSFAEAPVLQTPTHYISFIPQIAISIVFGVVFYFLIWKPQNKHAQERNLLLSSLKVNDTVYTSGGILGKITEFNDFFVKIEVAPSIYLIFQKDSIVALVPKNSLKKIF